VSILGAAVLVALTAVRPAGPVLTEAIEALGRAKRGDDLPELGIRSYLWHSDLLLSRTQRLVVVARLQGSTFLLFVSGAPVGRVEANEPSAIEMFDLNGDGVLEVMTETRDAWGTGVVRRRYHLYAADGTRVYELWSGLSYSYDSSGSVRGFVKFEYSSGGRLLHTTEAVTKSGRRKVERRAFVMQSGKVIPGDWPK
jgi:hypothetical protein